MLNDLKRYDDGSNHLNHIQLLTSDEYKQFLGVDKDFLNQYDAMEYCSFNIFRDKKIYDVTLRYWYLSLLFLSTVSTEWINKYLPQG